MKMKTAIQLSGILSWVNLLIAGCIAFFMLLGSLVMGIAQLGLLVAVFFGAIALHSYAALQLRKNILHATPMDNKTPTGIRIMGFISMFVAFLSITDGFVVIKNAGQLITEMQKNFPEQLKQVGNYGTTIYKAMGVFMILFGGSVLVNVILNMSLLRWYRSQENQE